MTTPATAKWPKPRSEDEFEDMCLDALRIRWKDPRAARNGRRGQRQHGVDIVGHPPWLKGKVAGAQCKNTDALTLEDVIKEAVKARSFPGGLDEFWIVTTADRDASLQADVREHFKAHPEAFHVDIQFWPDVVGDLASDDTLVAKHWKGFATSPSGDGWPRESRGLSREHVGDHESVECHCELALRTPGFAEVAANELASEVEALSRNGGFAGVAIPVMMSGVPVRESGSLRWSTHHREISNVIRKWELEIGESGFLAFRWSRFTSTSNHAQPMLEAFQLLDGVILPIRLHRVALERVTSRNALPLPTRLGARISCHATPSPLQLLDNARATLPSPRYTSAESRPDWSAEAETQWSGSSRAFAVRVLNLALGHFSVPGGVLAGPATFVKVDEDAVTKVGGSSF